MIFFEATGSWPGFIKRFSVFFAITLTVACSIKGIDHPVPQELLLLPPAQGPVPGLIRQSVVFHSEGHVPGQFLMLAKMDRNRIDLVVLLATGQKVLTLSYDGNDFHQQAHLQQGVPGREMLALFQLVQWPESAIRQHYRAEDGWIVEIDQNWRQLLTSQGVSVRVRYRDREVVVENVNRQYRVSIKVLD